VAIQHWLIKSEPDAYSFKTTDTASDIGFGLRLDLPIGPLRVDYGIPLQTNGRSSSGHGFFMPSVPESTIKAAGVNRFACCPC